MRLQLNIYLCNSRFFTLHCIAFVFLLVIKSAARTFFVIGNWKMNGNLTKISDILDFLNSIESNEKLKS